MRDAGGCCVDEHRRAGRSELQEQQTEREECEGLRIRRRSGGRGTGEEGVVKVKRSETEVLWTRSSRIVHGWESEGWGEGGG